MVWRVMTLDRFGIIFRPSPRQADLMIVVGYAHQQNGACTAPRYDQRRAALGIVYGFVCQRRWLLSLFLFRCARCRPRRAGRRLCAGLSADCGSPDLRPDSAPTKKSSALPPSRVTSKEKTIWQAFKLIRDRRRRALAIRQAKSFQLWANYRRVSARTLYFSHDRTAVRP